MEMGKYRATLALPTGPHYGIYHSSDLSDEGGEGMEMELGTLFNFIYLYRDDDDGRGFHESSGRNQCTIMLIF